MRGYRPWLLVAAALVVATAAYVTYCREQREAAHRDLLRFASLIKIGESRDDVRAALTNGEFAYLSLDRDDPSVWRVHTPLELGATNWRLLIVFDHDGRLAAIGFRTEDSERRHPTIAPADSVAPKFVEIWESRFRPH